MIKPNFTTLSQLKSILGLTTTDYDVLLTNNIQVVNDFLFSKDGYLNNEWLADRSCTVENDSEFIVDDLKYITKGSTFVIDGQGNDLYIVNDVDYDASKLYTNFDGTGLTSANIRLRVAGFGLKQIACQMCMYNVLKDNTEITDNVKSERIGDYSYTLADTDSDIGDGGYTMKYINALQTYRKVRFV